MDIIHEIKTIADDYEMVKYSIERAREITDDEQIIDLLTNYGLPQSVSPFINFFDTENANDVIYEGQVINNDCFPFAEYNGCLLCCKKNGVIVLLDSDNECIQYVNQNMTKFLFSVIYFNKLVNLLLEKNPDCDAYEECFDDNIIKDYIDNIILIDGEAFDENSFWYDVLEEIKSY